MNVIRIMSASGKLPRFATRFAFAWLLLAVPAIWAQEAAAPPRVDDIPKSVAPATAKPASDAAEASAASDIQKIIAAGRENSQVMAHLDYMVNRIGPRLTSSDGLTTACEWARGAFEGFGLENAHLEKWAEWPVGFNRGPWSGRMIAPEEIDLDFATNSWTPGTKGKVRGTVVLAPKNDDELTAVKDSLAGKWVLAPPAPARGRGGPGGGQNRGNAAGGDGARGDAARGDGARGDNAAADGQRGDRPAGDAQRVDNAQGGDNPQRDGQPADSQRRDGASADSRGGDARPAADATAANGQPGQGRRAGARRGGTGRGAVDPFQQKLRGAYEEAGAIGVISRTSSELIVTGGTRPQSYDFFNKVPTVAQVILNSGQYDKIAKHVRDGEEVKLEMDIRNHFRRGPVPLYNVIADIPGTQWPDEYVIVGGHIDSWDAATGTTDNGTGCATTMEAARILAASGVKPKRTIRFMLWSGEEQGLLGSKAYVAANKELMPKISAVLVHDAGTQFVSGINGLSTQMDDLKKVFAPVVGLDAEFPFEVRVTNALRGGGSDHASFLAAGVSGFFWAQSGDQARYRDTHHTTLDTYDRAVPSYQKHSSIVIALAAYGIANLDHMLAKQGTE